MTDNDSGATHGPLKVAIIVASDRCFSGETQDRSGRLLRSLCFEAGLDTNEPVVVPDEIEPIREAILEAVNRGARIVLTSGGTGIGPRDVTPEATRLVIEREVPGIAEAIRTTSLLGANLLFEMLCVLPGVAAGSE